MSKVFRLETHGPVALLRLERPPANALNQEFFVELGDTVTRLEGPDVGAVVLTGSGRFFSAGLDLFEVVAYDDAQFDAFTASFDAAFTALFALEKPVVAAINGHAIAGGAVLAAMADFRLMADGSGRAGLTEIQVGVAFPTSALEPIRLACAGPYLGELLYRGMTYLPHDAREKRLVDDVVSAADLLPRSLELAGELASRRPAAFAGIKRALRAEALARMRAARAKGSDPLWATWRTPETRAAMEEYRRRAVEKR